MAGSAWLSIETLFFLTVDIGSFSLFNLAHLTKMDFAIDTSDKTFRKQLHSSIYYMILSCVSGGFFDYYDYSLSTYFAVELGKTFFPSSGDTDTSYCFSKSDSKKTKKKKKVGLQKNKLLLPCYGHIYL